MKGVMADVIPIKKYNNIKRICLIGGGDLMVHAANAFNDAGYDVCSILAPRHAGEDLTILGGTLIEKLRSVENMDIIETEDINDLKSWSYAEISDLDTLAICFGPSWIFSTAVMKLFNHGMINVNLIPIPNYLGGAHFTWQILNEDRQGGCYFQEITSDVDRGAILFSHKFKVPKSACTPSDYFQIYYKEGVFALGNFIKHIVDAVPLSIVDFKVVNLDRIYFPRLITLEHAYIDWSWSAMHIERFCNAFDEPYAGAMTFLNGKLIHLKKITFVSLDHDFHPFCAGLIIRCTDSEVIVSAAGGALQIGSAVDEFNKDALGTFKEGFRLNTPNKYLEHAACFRPKFSSKGYEPVNNGNL
jgi:methionyl-tRNA formyltransferase